MSPDRQCAFVKADGSRCRARALAGKDRCFFHSEATAGARTEARKRGGKTRSKPAAVLGPEAPDLELDSVPDVVKLLGDSINRVRKGTLDSKVANAVGYLGSVLLRALEGDRLAAELEALRRDVEALKNDHRHDAAGGCPAAGAGGGAGGAGGSGAAGGPGGAAVDPDGGGAESRPVAAGDDVLPFLPDAAAGDAPGR
jgi:hypothetical protein